MKAKKLIQSVVRASEILNIVSENKEGITLKEIAEKINLGSSTVFYLINTLTHLSFIKHGENNKYKLGPKNLYLGNTYLENLSIYNISVPLLEKLINKFNENIYLVMLENNSFLSLIKLESTHSVRPTKEANDIRNAHATAIGKILLSSLPAKELDNLINKIEIFTKFTDNTITSIDKLHEELNSVRKTGFALDIQESEIGIYCIAVPVYDYRNKVKAALGTSMPIQRFSEKTKDKMLPALKDTAYQISIQLGYNKL